MSFLEIFQPGLKHLREERQRQQHDIAYPTDGADPLVDINLDAGTATIMIPARAGQPSATPSAEPDLQSSPADLGRVPASGQEATRAAEGAASRSGQ